MKTLILLNILAATTSFASGFKCKAICATVDLETFHATSFGNAEVEAGSNYATSATLFEGLTLKCARLASRAGYSQATPIDSLTASAFIYDSINQNYHQQSSYNVQWGPKITSRSPSEAAARQTWIFFNHSTPSHVWPPQSHDDSVHGMTYDVQVWRAEPETACKSVSTISDDETPEYVGVLPILGD